MTIPEYLKAVGEKKLFFVLYCEDTDLRAVYVKKFLEAHNGIPAIRESLDLGKQPRQIGKKPVYLVMNWEPGRRAPKHSHAKVNVPVMLIYTSGKPTQAQIDAYGDCVVEIPPVTGAQVTTLLKKQGLTDSIIDYLKEKTDTTQEALLIGKQISELSSDLSQPVEETFKAYFYNSLKNRNIDEEPTEFLQGILRGDATLCFDYIASQVGNEFFVFASLLNWIEDIIRFCSCNGDYWNDAGLVAIKYRPFKDANLSRIPYIKWIQLYQDGLSILQSLKINQPSPSTSLEVFLCHIIRTLM